MPHITVITPYKFFGSWVFDDPDHGINRETLVAGADILLEDALEDLGTRNPQSCTLFFSDDWFPGARYALNEVREGDYGGRWYSLEARDREYWLTPALLLYFVWPPPQLHIQVHPAAVSGDVERTL